MKVEPPHTGAAFAQGDRTRYYVVEHVNAPRYGKNRRDV